MKKIILSLGVIVGFGLYAVASKLGLGQDDRPVVRPSTLTAAPMAHPSPNVATNMPIAAMSSSGHFKNGTFTGPSVDAFYGNVQVRVTVAGGRVATVQFLDYPHDRTTSRQINSQATPYLQQEAIQAQSANVDIVSGATATSGAFQQSLAGALQQAQI